MSLRTIVLVAVWLCALTPCRADELAPAARLETLYRLTDGPTRMVNGLWVENPPEMKFGEGRTRVVIADLKGPGLITMIHFALPATLKMDRDTVLRIYWDGENVPSVESPLVDFFGDPNGALERVDSALVNKKRGWNCYFPMPFAKSARVEVSYENTRYPNGSWSQNPCYSYVMYRPLKRLPKDAGYFHAFWRQKTVRLETEEYEALDAAGTGQFIGWNVSVRGVGSPNDGYYVDMNEKFFVDGESKPSIEWQGLEDSFGFSWGFPEQANSFPLTGYQPFYNGAAAYRFLLADRISFKKALRLTIGFGTEEMQTWRGMFPKGMTPHQFSSVAYWYQKEPHRPFAALLASSERRPSLLPGADQKPSEPGETVSLRCGHPDGDILYLADGWDFVFRTGYGFNGPPWTSEIKHCWADFKTLEIDITCPANVAGRLRLYLLDGDGFAGGRAQSITVEGRDVGVFEGFQTGRWVEIPVSDTDTVDGRITVAMENRKTGGNAVVTYIRFIQAP